MMLADALFLLFLGTQGDRRPDDKRPAVVVAGCLRGSTLKVTTADTTGVRTDSYRLKISKSLSAALKEHQGHEEELSGLLTPSRARMGGGRTKKIGGRTKITVGTSEEKGEADPDPPQLEVLSFSHVAPVCHR